MALPDAHILANSLKAEMSLKLGTFLMQSAQFWFNVHTICDFLQILKKEKQITAAISKNFTALAACDHPSQRIC